MARAGNQPQFGWVENKLNRRMEMKTSERKNEIFNKKSHLRRQSIDKFFFLMERRQRVKLQLDVWKLCDENRALGGKHYRTVLKRFGLKEKEIWTEQN